MQKRYAAVGTGARLGNFTERLVRDYPSSGEVVGLCDSSRVRREAHRDRLAELGAKPPPTYAAEDFARMLEEQKPDIVIVCSIDHTHDHYINEALRHGVEVITEKPMATDAAKCRSILRTVDETGGRVRVAFNYRWMPWNTRVKELLASGTIGRVHSVNLDYLLNTSHGADYFRRWHSSMADSGGLLVHKSTHHFDLVNWWLDAIPAEVFAHGRLAFYGKKNALDRGDDQLTRYERYTDQPAAANDPFALNLRDGAGLERLYLEAEQESGYRRDRNVFRSGIDIFDTMAALVRYRTNALLTYSLTAFSPREGMRVSFNGDRGRIELEEFAGSHLIRGQSEAELSKEQHFEPTNVRISVFPHFAEPYPVDWKDAAVEGSHGGSDTLLGEQIFSPNPPADPWQRSAGHEQGAASILIGIAANTSIREKRPVEIRELAELCPGSVSLHELR